MALEFTRIAVGLIPPKHTHFLPSKPGAERTVRKAVEHRLRECSGVMFMPLLLLFSTSPIRYRKCRLCLRETIEGMIATRGLERTPFSMRLWLKRSGNLKVMSRRSDDFQRCHENTVRIPVDREMEDIVIDNVFANFRYDQDRRTSLT